jgi:hypothetical protein
VQRQTLRIQGPFAGFQPDLDPNQASRGAAVRMQNVLARSRGDGTGEVLTLPDGYAQEDSARLPLGDGSTLPASPTTDATPVLRIDQIQRFAPTGAVAPGEFTGEFIITPVVVTAGDGTANTGNMYRRNASGQWAHVAPDATPAGAWELSGERDGRASMNSMPDSCVAPFGATARAAAGDQSGPIQEPAWIYCNDVDEVMVFPSDSVATLAGNHNYEPLTDAAALDGGTGFKAKSCETWNGRVYFFNTEENGSRFNQRLRRTARFTCDPDPTVVGSGFIDFREFQGSGLRIEKLGDLLAVYFEDGVAFVQATGVATAPDFPTLVTNERGLLTTQAVTPVGRNVHFGVFTDGWWLLDQSGRWQEVGVAEVEGVRTDKWKTTFYAGLDASNRHRVYVYYDQPSNLVYITKPATTTPSGDIEETWIWDPVSDRVFVENYQVTCFGTITPLSVAGVQIDQLVGTIDDQGVPIDSFEAQTGFPKARAHGDRLGFVYTHDAGLETFDGSTPTWLWEGGLISPRGVRSFSVADRMVVEYVNSNNAGLVSGSAVCNSSEGQQTVAARLDNGAEGDLRSRDYWFRFASPTLGYQLAGGGIFRIRAIELDWYVQRGESRGL